MKRFGLPILAAALMAVPSVLSAQDALQAPLNSQEYLNFKSGSGVSAVWGGVQVGKYNGQLTSAPGQPQVTLYCVDFAHYAGNYTANVTNLGGPTPADGYSGLNNTRLGYDMVGDTQLRYRKAAFLASMFDAWSTTALGLLPGAAPPVSGFNTSSQRDAWSGIHAAIWTLMAPPAFTFPAGVNWVSDANLLATYATPWLNWTNQMASLDPTFGGMNFSEWSVLTDVNAQGQGPAGNSNGKQEFLIRTTVTPEPETWILLFSGMLLLGFAARRRLGVAETELG